MSLRIEPPSAKPDIRQAIAGKSVACSGRLASMSREDFAELIESYGGKYTLNVAEGTGVLVVGQKDWPLTGAGKLPQMLRQARVLTRRRHTPLIVISEDRFLAELGLEAHRQTVSPQYSTTTLTELLGVSRERVVAWVKAGLIKPAATQLGAWHFDFRQVSAAKMLCELARAGVSSARLRKSLEQLRNWMPEAAYPLEQLSVVHGDGRLLVRLADGDLAEFDGQLHFDFTEEPPAPSLRIHCGPHSAADWARQGLDQEAAGLLDEAEASYRQALLLGGPEAQVSFNLANVLAAQGQHKAAVERFHQALEIDPQHSEAWNNLGSALAELNQHDQACIAFGKSLALDPENWRAHYNLADTLDELGRSSEALPHWRAYLRYDSTSERAAYARSRIRSA